MNPLYLFIPLLFILMIACRSATGQTNQEGTVLHNTDISELGQLIQLPAQPQNVYWQTYEKGDGRSELGPTDWELVAILEYDPATVTELRTQMALQTHPNELFINPDFVKSWFPQSVKNIFVADAAYDDYLKLDGDRYEPDMFVQSPLLNGYVIVLDNLIFVYLYTM